MSKHALSAESDLLERDAELAAVEDLISTTPSVGRLLTIEGPPGIGKTSLLVEAKARGQAAGMQVVAARGSELERTFSYGVVRQLFEPLLARLPVEERAEALDGAAVLALPLFDPAQLAAPPAADSSLATLHGLYWLTANVAARRPLLLAVDDLHWCDLPSLRWLAYVLPRMEGLGVSIVVSLRTGEPGEDPNLLVQIVSDPLATVIRPAPLSTRAAARFVRQALSSDADDAFCAACHEETGGNPLLLRELMHAIAAEGLAPTQQNVPRLRELGARAGLRAVTVRLSRLAAGSRKLAQAVAILGDDADPLHAAALAELDGQAVSEAAGALARVDVLRPQPPFGFVHPLFRAAVYEALTPHERGIGHARAAGLLHDAGAEPERVAAHLLLTPSAADPGVVATLREAARRAASRGASETAVAYLLRALAEPPPAAQRAELLLELGSAEALVSGDAPRWTSVLDSCDTTRQLGHRRSAVRLASLPGSRPLRGSTSLRVKGRARRDGARLRRSAPRLHPVRQTGAKSRRSQRARTVRRGASAGSDVRVLDAQARGSACHAASTGSMLRSIRKRSSSVGSKVRIVSMTAARSPAAIASA
jgi:hypothetical protein